MSRTHKPSTSYNQDATTSVMFRWHKGEALAVFPCEPYDSQGRLYSCYAHMGQHSGCDEGYMRRSRPATPQEFANLKAELEAKPYEYRLRIVAKITAEMREVFLARLRNRSAEGAA